MNILYSPQEDNSVINIQDVVSTNGMLKVYPYEMINTSKAFNLLKNNSTTLLSFSQDNIINVELDENNNKYFEVAHSIKDNVIIDISNQTSANGKELKIENEIVCLSNYFYDSKLENIKFGNETLLPAFFTIGKPFNYEEYMNGIQQIFLATPAIEAKNSTTYITNNIDPQGLYEFTLINMSALESNYTNSKIIPIEKLINDSYKVIIDGVEKNGLSIELESTSLVNRIFAKGYVNNSQVPIDLIINEKLTPIKFTPISFNEKLSMFADWFDYDVCLQLFIAIKFTKKNGFSLEDLSTIKINNQDYFEKNPTTNKYDAIEMIRDMLAVSYAFATSFAQFKRITSGTDIGKLDPNQVIGSQDLKLTAIEDKDPAKVIDGIYQTYIRTHPGTEDDQRLKSIKTIITALSAYIYSSYAIGKGQNSYNEVYLPWFLRNLTSLSLKPLEKKLTDGTTATAWNLEENIKFQLYSRYFNVKIGDVDFGSIELKDKTNISKLKLIQTDRKLTIPFIGETIQEINKLPLPGDINTASSNDLQYIFNIPLQDNDKFNKLFLDNPVVKIDINGDSQPFDTAFTQPGHLLPTDINEIQKYIVNDYLSKHSALQASQVSWKSSGSIRDEETPAYTIESAGFDTVNRFNGNLYAKYSYDYAKPHGGNYTLTKEETLDVISKYIGIPKEAIIYINSISVNITHVLGDDYGGASSVSYKLKRQQFTGAIVSITNATANEINVNRDTLFDKSTWKQFIEEYIGAGGLVKYNLTEQNNLPINKIDEIVLSQVWGNIVKLHLNDKVIEIPLFNKDDESIGIQRIILS